MYGFGHLVYYTSRGHLTWLRNLREFHIALGPQRRVSYSARRASLPWREIAIDELESSAARRTARYRARQRRIAAVLPPSLRALVPVLMLDIDADIEIPTGRGIRESARIERLHRICRQSLDVDAPALSDADHKYLRRTLALLDPQHGCRVYAQASFSNADVRPGSAVAINVTLAERRDWRGSEPRPGCPRIGTLERVEGDRIAITPIDL
jgi:hypothetical protein